jgi:hypothetical protein
MSIFGGRATRLEMYALFVVAVVVIGGGVSGAMIVTRDAGDSISNSSTADADTQTVQPPALAEPSQPDNQGAVQSPSTDPGTPTSSILSAPPEQSSVTTTTSSSTATTQTTTSESSNSSGWVSAHREHSEDPNLSDSIVVDWGPAPGQQLPANQQFHIYINNAWGGIGWSHRAVLPAPPESVQICVWGFNPTILSGCHWG